MTSTDGDVPCKDCGTDQNIIWFTDNVLWNNVCVEDSPVLCIMCFVKRVEAVGYQPRAWRVIPEWEWTGEITPEHALKVLAAHKEWMAGAEEAQSER